MRVLLIGGAGFVGHHLALELRRLGHEVMVADHLVVNNYGALWQQMHPTWGRHWIRMTTERMDLMHNAGVEFRLCDARNYHRVSRIMAEYQPAAVIHLAAVAHIDRSNKDPWSTFDHSLRTLENALDAARAVGLPHFIYFSSSTAYGPFPEPVIGEETPLNPQGVYGSLKACGEFIVRAYRDTYHMPCTIVRPQALYGSRCVSGRVIQKFIEAAFDDGVLRIEGDGSAVHDFTHIADLVDGVVRILHNPASRNESFNITAAQARSLAQLAKLVTSYVGKGKIEHGPIDPQKPSRGTMSVDKAARLLGYAPQWPLERGIADYVAFYKEFLKCH